MPSAPARRLLRVTITYLHITHSIYWDSLSLSLIILGDELFASVVNIVKYILVRSTHPSSAYIRDHLEIKSTGLSSALNYATEV